MKTIKLEDYEIKLLVDLLDENQKQLSNMTCNDLYIEDMPLTKKEYKEFSVKFNKFLKDDDPYFHTQMIEDHEIKIVPPDYVGNWSIPCYFKNKFKELLGKKNGKKNSK